MPPHPTRSALAGLGIDRHRRPQARMHHPAWQAQPGMLGWEAEENTMTHSEFNHLLGSIAALSPEQMRRLRDELDGKLAASAAAGLADLTTEEVAEQEMQRRLVAAGVLSEIKPPRRVPPQPGRVTPGPVPGGPPSP